MSTENNNGFAPYCTYLMVYKGNKLPPFYIGMSKTDKILNGTYFGSIESKRYKEIWKHEIKNYPEKFTTKPLTFHNSKTEAAEKELYFQRFFKVHKNPMYINMGIVGGHLYYSDSVSKITRKKMSDSKKGIPKGENFKKLVSQRMKGVPKLESSIKKMVETRKERGSYTIVGKQFSKGNIPHNKGKIGRKIWMNLSSNNKLVLKEEKVFFESLGWSVGMKKNYKKQ